MTEEMVLPTGEAVTNTDNSRDEYHRAEQTARQGRDETLSTMPLTAHLIELRNRLIRVFGVVMVLFIGLLPFAEISYEWLSAPLRAKLPDGATMIAIDVTATFIAPFKLNFFVAIMIAMPFILHQLWQFIAPALYNKEKRIAIPLLLSSIMLFYLGVAFAYFITLPAVLAFFIHSSPDSVIPMTDINSYLGFCLKLFIVFGMTFEIPVAVLLLILAGIVSVDSLAQKRRYIITGCFFIAMFVTPPDALSMMMLAVSMWLLFEIGLLAGRTLTSSRS